MTSRRQELGDVIRERRKGRAFSVTRYIVQRVTMKVKKLFVEGGRQRQKKKNSARYRVKMKKFLLLKAAASIVVILLAAAAGYFFGST